MAEEAKKEKEGKVGKFLDITWVTLEYIAVKTVESLSDNARLMRSEIDLFLGATLAMLGLFNWSSAKYCDGNTADYLSCTRPATYYYYGAFEIALIVVGVLLVLVWLVKNRSSGK